MVRWFVYVDMARSKPTRDALYDTIGDRLCRDFGNIVAVLVDNETEGQSLSETLREAGFVIKAVDHTIPVRCT